MEITKESAEARLILLDSRGRSHRHRPHFHCPNPLSSSMLELAITVEMLEIFFFRESASAAAVLNLIISIASTELRMRCCFSRGRRRQRRRRRQSPAEVSGLSREAVWLQLQRDPLFSKRFRPRRRRRRRRCGSPTRSCCASSLATELENVEIVDGLGVRPRPELCPRSFFSLSLSSLPPAFGK